jgi:3-deoxy-D-manno-octulosonate 8-phosphate phosphatase (KDO 8-P phosphatase)
MGKPKLLIIDVDGVLCKDKLVDRQGKTIGKFFNDKNWTAIKEFKVLGIPVVFLSGDSFNESIAKKRNIPFYSTVINGLRLSKESLYARIKSHYSVGDDEIIFIADDIYDVKVLKMVRWAFCPVDAHILVQNVSWVLDSVGGDEVINEMLYRLIEEKILDQPDIDKVIAIDTKRYKG